MTSHKKMRRTPKEKATSHQFASVGSNYCYYFRVNIFRANSPWEKTSVEKLPHFYSVGKCVNWTFLWESENFELRHFRPVCLIK